MEQEGLLRHVRIWSAVALVLTGAPPGTVRAEGPEVTAAEQEVRHPSRGLVRPRRLTIGDHNHFMGVLGPEARYLYYVTDEFNSYDLFVQSPIEASGKPLFENLGDVVWPAISPNGEEVAYIRYQTEARGDACRRQIRENGKARSNLEECRDTDDADLQIYWRKDGRLGVLLREELHGDHVLLDGVFQEQPQRTEANVVGFTLSPDERWVAYVPLERLRDEIGVSFSNQLSADGIRIRRTLEGAPERSYQPALPGVSGYPVFSPDGDYLYFSQFLNDTNRDGVIDGDDNGVLFRVGFRGDGEEPEFGQPFQLTNAQWNCHYPSVQENAMALTCAIGDNLHIYLLPPSGAVPADWDQARIEAQTATVRNPWNELLLRQHLLTGARDDEARADQLRALTRLHIALRELEAAIYYAEQRKALLEGQGINDWWSDLMILFAQHQRADRALSRGRMSEEYVDESRAVAAAVQSIDVADSPDELALQLLVLGRIESDVGDKAAADQLFARVDLRAVQDEAVIDFAYQQFDRFYGVLADYETRLGRLKEVALHPASSVTQSLRHSKGFVDLLLRGRPKDQRLDRLVATRTAVPDDGRLALALDVEIALHQLTEENAKAIEEGLVRLYKRTENAHVRRYLVLTALRAAHRQGVESLQHALTERWIESVDLDDPERRTSVELYELVVMERAYGAFDAGDLESAVRYFDDARRATGSLAGHAGWIDAQVRLGSTDLAEQYEQYFRKRQDDPSAMDAENEQRFVEAYLVARDLGSVESNGELVNKVQRVRELLEAAIEEDPHDPLMHLLLAHAVHHQGMRLGSREDMSRAVRHYALAVDLAERRPRVRAPGHAGMALAQAALTNHRRALKDYEARFGLPFTSTEEEVALLLGEARSLFQLNKKREAIERAQRALELVEDDEELERYGPLVLDRLALYQLDAGRTEDALESHLALQQSLRAHPDADSAVNEVKAFARLSSAYLAAKQPETALRFARRGQEELAAADPLRPDAIDRRVRPVTHELVYDDQDFRALFAGLEANAAQQLGEWEVTRDALIRRKDILEGRYEAEGVDEILLKLAHTCLRLAEVEAQEGDLEQTQRYLEEGLDYTDRYAESTGSEVTEVGFHLLRAYADLHFDAGVELSSYSRDLEDDLLRYYLFLSQVRNPEWETERIRFEIFLSLLRMEENPAS